MKAYAVFQGEYSDWDLIGITLDREIADAMAKLHNGYVLEDEVTTDKELITKADNLLYHYRVSVNVCKGQVAVRRIKCEYCQSDDTIFEPSHDVFRGKGYYRNIEVIDISIVSRRKLEKGEIEKIAYDRIAQIKADNADISIFPRVREIEEGEIIE